MRKGKISLLVAGMTGVLFGLLYPEYILLPDTYQYIEELDGQKTRGEDVMRDVEEDIERMLYGNPDKVVISSRLLQLLAEEGTVLWKNLGLENRGMP